MPTCTDNCRFKTLNIQAHHDYPLPKPIHCVLRGKAVNKIPLDCDNYEPMVDVEKPYKIPEQQLGSKKSKKRNRTANLFNWR